MRRDNIQNGILHRRDSKCLILYDRYIASSYAYQHGIGGVSDHNLFHLHYRYCWDLFPDLTIYLSVSPEEAIKRTGVRENPILDTTLNRERLYALDNYYRHMESYTKEGLDKNLREWGEWLTIDTEKNDQDSVLYEAINAIKSVCSKVRSGVEE